MLKRILPILALMTLLISPFAPAPAAAAASWQPKVDPWVLETAAQGQTEFLVFLTEQTDLSGAAALPTKAEKGAFVYQRLVETAQRTQRPLIAALERMDVEYRSFWVVNALWVRGDLSAVQALAQRSDVAHLYANPSVKLDAPVEEAPAPQSVLAVEWNITNVNAPQVWAVGTTGQGVVIGGQDTGYDWDHPALINQYRGWNGISADHNYNWYDATDNPSATPIDPVTHGTHTMGTMVGDDGGSNQIGMAPGARWIGCRNMDAAGNGTPATYITCYQWFIAPTDLNGLNADPALAPDVINNSWSCPVSEGCPTGNPNILLQAVQNLRAAGIFTAHSAGNNGSSCSTVSEPAAIYAESFSVGATTSSNVIASYSSRGPVTVDGSNRAKPDISAPGSSVRSCIPGTGYGSKSGTSMAAPHVAGLVALLISAEPGLRGQVDLLERLIESSAVPVIDMTCGGSAGGVPNNTYGWGRIDALAALESLQLSVGKQALAEVAPGETLTYTLSVTHTRGSDPLVQVVLTDTLPVGTEFVSATPPYNLAGDVITWQFASLALGESQQVSLAVRVTATKGVIENLDYGASAEGAFPAWGQRVETIVVPHEITLEKTAAALVAPGSALTYTLTVSNAHLFAGLTGLVLTDTLPAGTEFLNATQPYTLAGGLVTWALPPLDAGQSWPVTLVVRVTAGEGVIENLAYGAMADYAAPVSGAAVETLVVPHEIALQKSAPERVAPGSVLTYTLVVSNPHPFAGLSGLVLTDTLPVGTEFISATQPYTRSGEVITWQAPYLGSGQSWPLMLAVRVPLTFTGTLTNHAYGVSSLEVSRRGEPVQTQIFALAVNKTASADWVAPGGWLTYTLTVTNLHPSSAVHQVVLSDTLPQGVTFITATQPYSQVGGLLSWQVGELAPGEVRTFTLVVQAPASLNGWFANTDYRAWAEELGGVVQGQAVWTWVRRLVFLPLVGR